MYEANNINKGIFFKNLLDFSDDFSRSVAKNQFWYLDSDDTTVTVKKRTLFTKIITKPPGPIGTTTPNSFQMS